MKIFAVLPPAPNLVLDAKIEEKFPGNNMRLATNQWLVAGNGTAVDVSHQLGITSLTGAQVNGGSTGIAVVLAMSSYFGTAPTNVWDWIKTKLEASA